MHARQRVASRSDRTQCQKHVRAKIPNQVLPDAIQRMHLPDAICAQETRWLAVIAGLLSSMTW